MPKFKVGFAVHARAELTIEADTREEARYKAVNMEGTSLGTQELEDVSLGEWQDIEECPSQPVQEDERV